MSGAPYQLDLTFAQGSTIEFSVELVMQDGSAFPWADYDLTYSVRRNGYSNDDLSLTSANGITVDAAAGNVTFASPAGKPRCGVFNHFCKATSSDGIAFPVFDGTLTILEEND